MKALSILLFVNITMLVACDSVEKVKIQDNGKINEAAGNNQNPYAKYNTKGRTLSDATEEEYLRAQGNYIFPWKRSCKEEWDDECLQSVENTLLPVTHNNVVRKDNCLKLISLNGDSLTICNDSANEDKYLKAYLHNAFIEHNLIEVILRQHEYNGYKLFNTAHGESPDMMGPSLPSPDGKFVISSYLDLIAGFQANGFELYELKNNSFKLSSPCIIDESWGVSEPAWLSNNIVIFKKYIQDNNGDETHRGYLKISFRHSL